VPDKIKVLIIEDSLDDCEFLVRDLKKEWDLSYLRIDTRSEMIEALTEPWDVILSDFSMPKFTGLSALETLKTSGLDIPFIIISGTIGEEAAVDVMRAGADDYVLKSKRNRLMLAIRREMDSSKRRKKNLVTEKTLKDTEEQLRHMQKMEAVGQLAGGVAHDFNNMLSIVQIYCRKLKELNIPEVNQYVEKILNVHNRSISLTRQLLVFSRKQPDNTTVLDVHQILHGMQDMLQRLLGENVELSIQSSADLYKIKADQGQIEQVIMNLAVNARDAMPKGGDLRFSAKNVSFKEPFFTGSKILTGNYVMVEAKDNGTGMSKEIISRVFEPFFTTKSAKSGTGLGLSIIYGIIHQSEGEILVSSELGQGTTFTIYLPETQAVPLIKSHPAHKTHPNGGHEKILLVEDNAELRQLFAEILEGAGYKVFQAADGQEALNMLEKKENQYDLVITDMIMPKISGRDLHKRAFEKDKDIRFLYMSGYFEDEEKKEDGDFYFLQKPFGDELLLEKVRTVLDT
jgi:two-component system cell cycle sensor histidine kinase/response regulator CckA